MTAKPDSDLPDFSDDPSTFMPFRSGIGHYDPVVAKAFFKAFGRKEKIAAGTTIFMENEKSNKQTLFKKSAIKALATPLAEAFAKQNIHRMFLLTKGEVGLSAGGKSIDTVRPGDVFGEMAVISEIPDIETPATRTATAQAATDCEAYSLDGTETLAGLAQQPEFAFMLMSVMFDRLRFLAARLATTKDDSGHRSNRSKPIFDVAVVEELRHKLDHATVVRFAEGAKILREGKAGTIMYVVLEGKVAITIGRRIVEKLEVGGVFGEMALVDQSTRAANAIARSDCILLSINRESLMQLVKDDPAFGMAMMRSVAERLRYMNGLLA